ncbi:hypothetical protein diail_8105 [Diaporthe ilicicola]|nr:hypothetical protein diail_8105 [Diaporthe ilicicola]
MDQMENAPPPARHLNGTHNLQCKTPIAVVGMACRFPGVDVTSPAQLWKLCAEGRGSGPVFLKSGQVAFERLGSSKDDGHDRRQIGNGHSGKEEELEFDSDFFGIADDVASALDSRTRMLLEVVHEATEDAGIPVSSLAGTNTSVFSGFHGTESVCDPNMQSLKSMPSPHLEMNGAATPSSFISQFYKVHGVSDSTNTSRSSNLIPLHQGCQTIQSGESEVSIVCAASTSSGEAAAGDTPTPGLNGGDAQYGEWNERSEARNQMEGAVALVLKSLDAAFRDGERVHCVIRTTSLKEDGATQSTASPLMASHVHPISETYRAAGLDLRATGYTETHAADTRDADLAAASALAQTVGPSQEADDLVLDGSVETAIGRAGPVTGLAAIIKLAYSMRNRQVVASRDDTDPNPGTQVQDCHPKDLTTLLPWPPNKPIRASIHSPGGRGASSHAIVEAPPSEMEENGNMETRTTETGEAENTSRVFVLSAADADTLRTVAHNLSNHLKRGMELGESVSHSDLAYTLAERRSRLRRVAAVRANSTAELAECLERHPLKISTSSKKKRLGFVFNGQGAQWNAMGRELLTTYPVFASAVQEADAVLRDYGADWSLQEELMRDAESTRVSEIHISQPITVALQLSLVRLLRSWGVHPSAVVSHSTGEIAAAFTAGALSFSQALGIVYHLGDLGRKYYGNSAQAGGMAAAAISAQDVQSYLADTSFGGDVVVACINSPQSVTLSGDMADLDEVLSRLDRDGIFARKLRVPMAYHSHLMLPMAAEYAERLRQILALKPVWAGNVVYASPTTGALVDSPDMLTAEHWINNITGPVLFADAFDAMAEHVDGLLEIGPHSTLSGPIREILGSREVAYMSCLKRPFDAVNTMQDLACDLVGFGYSVSLRDVNRDTAPKFVPDLPAYPWKHSSEALPQGTECSTSNSEVRLLRSKSVWEPDILHDIPEAIKDSMRITLTQDEADLDKTLVRASYYFISDAVLQLQKESRDSWSPYSQELFGWMVATVAAGKKSGFGPGSAMWSRASRGMKQALYDDLGQGKTAPGLLVARVGAKLADIVRGQVSPLDLLTKDDLLNRYYSELPSLKSRSYKHLSRATEIFAIKVPGAKVLEVGAGTGGATRAVLDGFGARATSSGGTLLGNYTFTDIKPEYIEAARQNLGDWGGLIEFDQLDVQKNTAVLSKSLAVGTYDLIVASLVLQETQDVLGALKNLRKMLKPGGRLFLVETTKEKLDAQLVFKVLPQWWSSEKVISSRRSPVVSVKAWDEVLRDTGFTGVDFEIGDSEQHHFQSTSFIISTAATTPTLPSTVTVVYTTPAPEVWHRQLTNKILEGTSISSVTAESWEALDPEDKIYIFTGDMPGPFVGSMNEASFHKLRQLLDRSRRVLWLSHGGAVDAQDPLYAQTFGLLRTSRSEDACKRFIHLDFEQDSDGPWSASNIGHIVHVLRHTMDEKVEPRDVDWEYSVKNSMLHIPRVFPIPEKDDELEVGQQQLPLLEDPNATFLIVGDVGGIGQELALGMIAKGARNLLIVDPDAEKRTRPTLLLETAEKEAGNVQVHSCDVSSEEGLVELLKHASVSMPPICGVILVDALNGDDEASGCTTFDQWKHAALSRVTRTLNLDRYLPPSLSFFVVLSSLSGVLGQPPEVALSVGSAFQAAFARNRAASGRSFTCIDIGSVGASGGDAEDAHAREQAAMTIGSTPMSAANILQLVEDAIRRRPATPQDAQVIVGLPMWSEAISEDPVWRDRRFRTMRLAVRWAASATKAAKTDTLDPSSLLVQALGLNEEDSAAEAVALATRARLAAILRMEAEEIGLFEPLATYGVDSLIAVEMRSWLATASSVKLSVLDILNAVSLQEMAKLVVARNQRM